MKRDLKVQSDYPTDDYLFIFDNQFTITDFSDALKKVEAHSESVLSSARAVVQKAFAQEHKEPNYTVVMSDELKEAIHSGSVELVTSKSGEVYAQLRKGKGRFGKPLPIKEELSEQGITVEALQLALQMEAIKEQIQIIIEGLKEIESRVTDVIHGQRNDRIGLFYSGLSLYIEARSIKDEFLKKQITAQALKSISDANAQMIQDLRTSMEYLLTEQYRHSKKMTEKIEEHLAVIHQCYDVVYRAFFLKAAIYQENRELASMLTAIDEYGRFIEKMIVPYAGKLSELDKHDKFIEKGTWGAIAKTLVGCRELKQQICENSTYYLSMEGTANVK